MSGEDEEVAIESLDVEYHVLNRLGGVDQGGDAAFVGGGDNGLDGVNCTDGVGYMGDGGHFRSRAHESQVGVEIEVSVVEYGSDFENGAGSVA